MVVSRGGFGINVACKRLATSEAMPWFVVIETLFSLDAREATETR